MLVEAKQNVEPAPRVSGENRKMELPALSDYNAKLYLFLRSLAPFAFIVGIARFSHMLSKIDMGIWRQT